jgi:hypothetical protein
MASRWMIGVRMRQRAFRKRQGNLSFTKRERKFYYPRMNESIDHHIERMRQEAAAESARPTEWWRVLARLLQKMKVRAPGDEWTIVRRGIKLGYTVEQIEQSIRRYRKLTGYVEPPEVTREDEFNALTLI